MKSTSEMTKAFRGGGVVLLFVFTLVGHAVAQICVEPPAGLISWWPADGNANDIQGVNDGTLLDGAAFAAGMVGQAFSFDGTSRVSAPTTGLPTGDSNRTLDLWVKVNNFVAGEALFAGYGSFGSFDQTYHLGTSGNILFFSQWGQAVFGPALQTGRWYHVAVTNAGTSVTLYLDGAAVASSNLSINTPSGTQLFVGSLPGDTFRRLDGLIDEVEVSNRTLSASEIRAIFNAGRAGKCKASSVLDHFKCYKAKGERPNVAVDLQHQFGVDPGVLVRKPALFCNPVNKNGEGIRNPAAHLTCYQIEADGEKRDVVVGNQFGEQTLKVKEPKLLCVPSDKIDVIPEEDDDEEDGEER